VKRCLSAPGFTHVAESVLDKVRNGEIAITSELVALFLGVGDHLGAMIVAIAGGIEGALRGGLSL